jgi:hypothetical protein
MHSLIDGHYPCNCWESLMWDCSLGLCYKYEKESLMLQFAFSSFGYRDTPGLWGVCDGWGVWRIYKPSSDCRMTWLWSSGQGYYEYAVTYFLGTVCGDTIPTCNLALLQGISFLDYFYSPCNCCGMAFVFHLYLTANRCLDGTESCYTPLPALW